MGFQMEVCGVPDVNVKLLMQIAELRGFDSTDPECVRMLWRVLQEDFTAKERTKFLEFVWARARLPAERTVPFVIKKKKAGPSDSGDPDLYLPSAKTRFFELELPEYSSAEILSEKLK